MAQHHNEDTIVLNFTGDVTLSNHFEYHVKSDYNYAFKNLKWFSQADISMVNFENPLTTRGEKSEKKFNFRARPDYVKVLLAGGVDIVTLANNHIYDYGQIGLEDTIEYLKKAGIKYVGAGRNEREARHPVIYYIKGKRIAFFGYYGTGKHSNSHPATADSAGTAMRSLSWIKKDIKAFREKVDYIIVNFHWGDEKATYPSPGQIDFAHKVIDYGADVIVGHHPHVLQGVELYKGKVIAYSLGNFIFGGNSRRYEQTAILQVKIKRDTVLAEMIPIEVKAWQPQRLTGVAAHALTDSLKTRSSIFKYSVFPE